MRNTTNAKPKPAITVLRRFEKKAAMLSPPDDPNDESGTYTIQNKRCARTGRLEREPLGASAMDPRRNHETCDHHRGEVRGDDSEAQGHREPTHGAGADCVEDRSCEDVRHVGVGDRRDGPTEARVYGGDDR